MDFIEGFLIGFRVLKISITVLLPMVCRALAQFYSLLLYGFKYSNGNFFLVGDDGISASSTNWKLNPIGIEKKLTDIVFVNSKYFAVGESGTLLSSINGQNWVQNKLETLLKIKGITSK